MTWNRNTTETKTDISKFISFRFKFFRFVSVNGIKFFQLTDISVFLSVNVNHTAEHAAFSVLVIVKSQVFGIVCVRWWRCGIALLMSCLVQSSTQRPLTCGLLAASLLVSLKSSFIEIFLCTLCLKKMHQLWNGIAQNYKDQFWWHLAEIFKRLYNRVCMLQFSCRFACYHVVISSCLRTKNNTCMFLLLTGSVMHNFRHFRLCRLGQILN